MSKKLLKAVSEKKVLDYFKTLKDESSAYKELDKLDKEYYNGNALLSDPEYDVLRDYLNSQYASIKEKVGKTADEKSLFEKVVLEIPMGSLEKVNSYADLLKWFEKYTSQSVVVSHKIDGSSIELSYENGELVRAVTRGNGTVGDNITANARHMGFPKNIQNLAKVKIRGEVVMFLSIFEKHLKGEQYKNARNSVAGIMSRIDGKYSEFLNVIGFDIIDESHTYNTKMEKFDALMSYGFKTPCPVQINSFEDYIKLIEKSITERPNLNYLIDGLVGEENDLTKAFELGSVNNRPKAAKAFKFESESAETYLREVIWQVGKSGRITPVGIVDATDIQGVTIVNVMLNNMQYILDHKIEIGAKVLLVRANDVIPKIEATLEAGTNPIIAPHNCPSCGSVLDAKDIKHITCVNHEECPLQSVYRITHFLKTLEVKGMGDKMIEKMLDENIISDISDLYKIDMKKVEETEGLSLVNVQKAYKELIEKSKNVSLPRFIKSLTIKGVGETVAELVMSKYDSLEKMFEADYEVLNTINGIGESASAAFIYGMNQRKNLIKELTNNITFAKPITGSLSGMSVCFTGFRDQQLKKDLEAKGAKVVDSYNKTITYLVCLDKNEESSKILKAKKDKVQIIDKEELLLLSSK